MIFIIDHTTHEKFPLVHSSLLENNLLRNKNGPFQFNQTVFEPLHLLELAHFQWKDGYGYLSDYHGFVQKDTTTKHGLGKEVN